MVVVVLVVENEIDMSIALFRLLHPYLGKHAHYMYMCMVMRQILLKINLLDVSDMPICVTMHLKTVLADFFLNKYKQYI